MVSYSTTMHGPAASAPTVTGLYAVCAVCGAQWQILGSEDGQTTDDLACRWCGAPAEAVAVHSEAATVGGATVYGGGEV